jgi:hypothetical protein
MPKKSNTMDDIYRMLDSITPDKNGCHPWLGTLPHFRRSRVKLKGRLLCVNRIVLERKLDRPIRSGYMALHTCDHGYCVNSDHIYEGTQKDNMQDRIERNPESYQWLRTPEYIEKLRTWPRTSEYREKLKTPERIEHCRKMVEIRRAKWRKEQ